MLTSNETRLFASLQGLNTTQAGRDIVRIIESFRWMTHTENESNTYPKLQVQTIGIGPFYLITAHHSISGHALISEIGCADAVLSMSIAPRQHTKITHRDNVAVGSTKWSEWYDYRSPWEWSPEPDRVRPYQTADLWVRWETESAWERVQMPMEVVLWGILGAMDRQDVTEEELIRDVLLILRDGEESEIENLAPQAALWVRRDLESFAVIPAGVLESAHPTADQWIKGKTLLRQAWRSRNAHLLASVLDLRASDTPLVHRSGETISGALRTQSCDLQTGARRRRMFTRQHVDTDWVSNPYHSRDRFYGDNPVSGIATPGVSGTWFEVHDLTSQAVLGAPDLELLAEKIQTLQGTTREQMSYRTWIRSQRRETTKGEVSLYQHEARVPVETDRLVEYYAYSMNRGRGYELITSTDSIKIIERCPTYEQLERDLGGTPEIDEIEALKG